MTNTPNQTDIIVGKNIRRIRNLRGLSQTTLGEAAGITFQQVQKYEKGANRISASRIEQFCQILSCSLDDLFDGTSLSGRGPHPFLSKRALELAVAFDRVGSTATQRSILALVETLSEQAAGQQEKAAA